MKTPNQYAKHLKKEIGSYEALFVCNLIISIMEGMHKPEYAKLDCIGEKQFDFEGEYLTHLTGYDLKEYFKEVKKELPFID